MFFRGSKVVEKQCASGGRLKAISRPGITRLLLVDDAQMFIELLRMALVQDENIEIVGLANGGAQALRLAAATQPDLVLLDIKMPGVCGLHLIEPLRRKVPAVKIIMLSAFLDPFTVHRVVHSKVEGYVEKSCSLKLLRCAASGQAAPIFRRGLSCCARILSNPARHSTKFSVNVSSIFCNSWLWG